MRYAKSESTNILSLFNSGDTVTIDVYKLSDNTKVVDGATCSEIESTGVFSYNFSQNVTQKEEFLWIMTNGEYSKYGKIVLGGYMDVINDNINQHRNIVEPKIDTNISSRASQESVNAIPTNPLLDNDSRLDNLDAKISSRSSHSPADVWNYSSRTLTNPVNINDSDKDDIVDRVWDEPIADHVTDGTFGAKNQNKVPSESLDDYKADTSNLALESTVLSIKNQTDKFKFNTDNDVVATLDGETVTLSSETETQIDNIENNVTNYDQYKADTSDLAKEATVQAVKRQTDKLQFTDSNDVKATLDGEVVILSSDTESQIDEIESAVNQIKTKTDNLPNDPASNADINNAKDNIITEIQLNRDLINELLDIEEGNWEIKNNQMIFYKRDGSELIRFNLYDKLGNLTELNAYKRQRV